MYSSGGTSKPVVAAAALAVAALLAPGAAAAAPSGGKLTISPAPNTPDASPQTQISILGAPRGSIQSVQVTGSASGAHTGVLRSYSKNRGASFIPAQPLTQGESVAVVVKIRGRRPISFSFTVARLGPPQPPLNLTSTQPDKLDHFTSEPSLQSPHITVNRTSRKTRGSGDVLMTPLPSPTVHPETNNTVTIKPVGPGGPMIVDGSGNLVWFQQLKPPEVAANLRLQRFNGKDALTWWQGTVTPTAFGVGAGLIANHRYQVKRIVNAGNGYPMDLHDFTLTDSGDALLTIYSPILVHLPGTPDGTLSPLLDAIVQEVDVRTGLVVWEWHAYGHIPLETSQANPQNSASFDAFHFNSIQPLKRGRVLISARDTSGVYLVDQASGRILWTLGGKGSNFQLGPGAQFYFQHDVQMLPHGRISLFDDGAGPPMLNPFSRGLILKLNTRRHRANLVRQFVRSTDTSAQSEGSVQTLPSGNVFVGYGSTQFFSEFSSRGGLLFDAALPQDDGSYRMYREKWKATPTTPPAVAARRTGPSTVSVFASWNGATKVARWRILAGQGGALSPIATVPRTGFETQANLTTTATTFAVRALNSRGRVLATSGAVPAS
jgi:hypothetical protein